MHGEPRTGMKATSLGKEIHLNVLTYFRTVCSGQIASIVWTGPTSVSTGTVTVTIFAEQVYCSDSYS